MSTMSIRIPESLHRGIKELATKDGYTMNQFIITAAAEKLSALSTVDYLRSRAESAGFAAFEKIMEIIPKVPPDAGDELP